MAATVTNLTQIDPADDETWTLAIVAGADHAFPTDVTGNQVGIDGTTNCQQLANTSTALVLDDWYSAWSGNFPASASYDISATDSQVVLHFRNNSSTFTWIKAIRVVLFSGGGTTNYAYWDFAATSSLLNGQFWPLACQGGSDGTGGTFDNTDVTGIGFLAQAGTTGGTFGFQISIDQAIHHNGPVVFEDTGAAATVTLEDYYDLLKPTSGTTYHSLLVARAGSTIEFGFPIDIQSDDYDDSSAAVGIAFKATDGQGFPAMPADFYSLLITGQASGSIVFENAQFATLSSEFNCTIDGSAASTSITLSSVLIASVDAFSCTGAGVTSTGLTVSAPTTTTIADGDLDITVNGSGAPIQWTADLAAGSTITTDSDIDVKFDVGDYSDISINMTASKDFAVDPSTVGAYNFNGLTSTGTVNLDNDSATNTTINVTGLTYTIASPTTGGGSITVTAPPTSYTLQLPNIINSSRFQIYNVTTATELTNSTTSGGSGIDETYTAGVDYTAGDTGRYRVTYQSGTSAKKELTGTFTFAATTTTNSLPISQDDDPVYNTNAIDGSLITKFTADYVNDEVDLSIGSNFTIAEMYAWWTYNNTTSQGISDFFGGIVAIDGANFNIKNALVDIYLDNTTATNYRQTDTPRIFRDDGAYPVRNGGATSGGGGLDVTWQSVVYLQATGSAVTAQDKQDIKNLVFDEIVEDSESFRSSVRIMRAESAGKVSVSGPTVSFRDAADTKDRIIATVDENGQRTAVTVDGS